MKNIIEGQTFSFNFVIALDQVEDFAALTGDNNPLHLEASFAQACGFKERVVYGGLLIGQISKLLGTEFPGPGCLWQSLDIQFKSPLYIGEQAQMRAKVIYINSDLKIMRLSIEIWRGENVIALGSVQAGWLESVPGGSAN